MKRGAVALLSLALLAVPLAAGAQPTPRIPRVGYLSPRSPSDLDETREAFRQGLRDLGYIEGRTIAIEWRFAERKPERLRDLAAELVRQKVDLIVADTTPAIMAAKQATTTIPIVMPGPADAVGSGLVASLSRPGGNVTGMSFLGSELVGKRLELVKETVPGITRVAVLWHPGVHGEGTVQRMREETEVAARALGVGLQWLEARSPNDLVGAFSSIPRQTVGALLVWPSPMFLTERKRLVELAAKRRIPTIYYLREFADAGGLVSYGPSLTDLFRRAATYVDKILKGAKPSDLPVEQPTTFELVINMKTAKALGLRIPPSVLARADKLIQ